MYFDLDDHLFSLFVVLDLVSFLLSYLFGHVSYNPECFVNVNISISVKRLDEIFCHIRF